MSNNFISHIIEYAKTLPDWQKILAKLAFDSSREITEREPEIEAACNLLKKDWGLCDSIEKFSKGSEEIKFIQELGSSDSDSSNVVPRLVEIKNCENVNALSPEQRITFAPKLTIIYGENGAGKSGYSRVLNSAFYSRGDKNILPNVLKPKQEQGSPKAVFEFNVSSQKIIRMFPDNISASEFKQFACFDSKTVQIHLANSNELYVMPKEMDFFERLVASVKLVVDILRAEAISKKKLNPFLNLFQEQSDIKSIVLSLNEKTNFEEVKKLTGDLQQLKLSVEAIEKDYLALKSVDPKVKIEEITTIKGQLNSLKTNVEQIKKKYFDSDVLTNLRQIIQEFEIAQKESRQSGIDSFKTTLFKTIGSEQWKSFISSTFIFCEHESFVRETSFPKVADHCPLCHQSLSDQALELFNKYLDYLKGEFEKKLKQAQEKLNLKLNDYEKINVPKLEQFPKLYLWLESDRKEDKQKLGENLQELDSYSELFLTNLKNYIVLDFNKNDKNFFDIIDDIQKFLTDEAAKFNESEFKENLVVKEKELIQQKHKLKLSEKIEEVHSYLNDLKWSNVLETKISNISTRSITDKQKQIFQEYFSKQYRQHFFNETKQLNVNFQIDVISKGTSGKTTRKLDVLNYSPALVLSEGEQRAIALADFLTEVEVCKLVGGLIFDDPVNSLDHERREHIARRLVLETNKRQIIIFTHDVSFLFDIINEAERFGLVEKKDYQCHWITKLNNKVGIVNLDHRKELELDYKSTTRAESHLKQALTETDPLKREWLCRNGFDCLRKTYEAFVVTELFANTVRRFDRQIKYKTLTEVFCPKEILMEVSSKLEYCSGFISGHLPADGYSSTSVSPELLRQEIEYFNNLKKEFKEKRKTISNVH